VARKGKKLAGIFRSCNAFACHHSLTAPEQSWRQEGGGLPRAAAPADPPWNGSRYAVFAIGAPIGQQMQRTARRPGSTDRKTAQAS